MRSTKASAGPPLDDRTTRARIRDAALELFAERGVHGTSIRDIAGRAEVSAGLVQHHFGSKDGIREACDAHVIDTVLRQAEQAGDGAAASAELLASMYAASERVVRYLARALVDDSPGVGALFDRGAELTAQWLTRSWPERYPAGAEVTRQRAATMTAMHLGTLVLHAHLARWMGLDPLAPGQAHVISAAMLDVYTAMSDYLASETGVKIRRALAEYQDDLKGRKATR
ncbi:transcriptional regulator, TetR family [Nannocystis exedens]|uniref:Transcriptional regulator, TetR family n=1 Tax=Nannocystis exedens TaxID=54 RepID=A0A1I1ZLR3_9BACT|nr:TetR/AcrR family transcriptional regulator [Nannocystis exedens]PCC75446.1 TetR family transcriptional regulator [Nannocystis exedens]SFE32288.1 transcriptional regulator, TetR family [Nannocystis exedens]